jgi:hypothetical protein
MFTNAALLALCVSAVNALEFGPAPTAVKADEVHPQGWTPRPTKAPSMNELRKRITHPEDVLVGPDSTCGFSGKQSGKQLNTRRN